MLACLNMAPVSPARPAALLRCPATARRQIGAAAALTAWLLLASGCAGWPQGEPARRVTAVRNAQGVQLLEAGAPVLFYRRTPEPGREPWRMHYVHPLHSIAGAVVTEDAPADHVHHRGLFWAWRRILVDGARVADGWVGDRLVLEVGAPRVRLFHDGSAQIDVRATWVVPLDGRPAAIIEENSSIRAYPSTDGQRRVDVEVRLRALRPGVALAGTDDDKGYGGLSMRFANPQLVEIESDGRRLRATVAAMDAGASLAFLWPTLPAPWPPRIDAACRVDGQPWTRWVLRQELSMQNCAFPGPRPVPIPTTGELRLSLGLLVS